VTGLRNVGRLDAALRILLGIWLLGLAASQGGRPYLAIGWGAIGLLVLGTGCLRVCPLYTLIRALGRRTGRP
jgi:hypothetical protein